MRRQARLFAIAEYLRGRRTGTTAAQIAARFEVDVRTVYRDLDALREGELPVRADRGRGGGYALDRAYALPPVNFTAREAAVLVALGDFARRMRLLPFADTLGGALDKVRAALSGSAQRELLDHLATLELIGVPAPAVLPAVQRAVEEAWFERRLLVVRDHGAGGTMTERRVRIRTVVMERGGALLNCDDLDKGEARQFRLDRIESARTVTEGN